VHQLFYYRFVVTEYVNLIHLI